MGIAAPVGEARQTLSTSSTDAINVKSRSPGQTCRCTRRGASRELKGQESQHESSRFEKEKHDSKPLTPSPEQPSTVRLSFALRDVRRSTPKATGGRRVSRLQKARMHTLRMRPRFSRGARGHSLRHPCHSSDQGASLVASRSQLDENRILGALEPWRTLRPTACSQSERTIRAYPARSEAD